MLTYPKTYDQCPKCGSKNRIAEQLARNEKAKGRIGLTVSVGLRVEPAMIIDPPTAGKTAPTVFRFFDQCYDCCTEYVVRVEVKEMETKGFLAQMGIKQA